MSKKQHPKSIWSEHGTSGRVRDQGGKIVYIDDFVKKDIVNFIPLDDVLANEDEGFKGKPLGELYDIVNQSEVVLTTMGMMAPDEMLEYAAKRYRGSMKEYRRALQDIASAARAFDILSNLTPELTDVLLESKGRTFADYLRQGAKIAKYFLFVAQVGITQGRYKPAYDAVKRELEPLGVQLIDSLHNKIQQYGIKDNAA
ncbi:hypothetical protein J4206_01110 [Candidatus Woesearchaeota archaeon]|nr:hypothetical protein [Candidatus Woesearchaeota archaeon]